LRFRQASLNSAMVSTVRGCQTILRRMGGGTVTTWAPASSASFTSIRCRIDPTMIRAGSFSRSMAWRVASMTGRES